jgi:hypothetical protein
MDHLEFHQHEMDALRKTPFELWAAAVERILGHDLDGDQQTDGYSLDGALAAFERGVTVRQYVNSTVWMMDYCGTCDNCGATRVTINANGICRPCVYSGVILSGRQ